MNNMIIGYSIVGKSMTSEIPYVKFLSSNGVVLG